MFFFIGGITPKVKILSKKPEICPVCGLAQAWYKRTDHYLNLFFIPVFRVRTGEPFLMCERCERSVHEMGAEYEEFLEKQDARCPHCNRSLHPEFKYCPHCGKKV
ncbi:zinc ribbon domain-containing protein [Desulfonema ishimotonii]|uniref:Zinc ribbon domain-containing protein n=1 Tax=Desulfonema ishimotonii TaxID=45657 RepID=A0A401G0P3_9BACT|nr:zinc ribbon domain-containing protein [Desulfonema ishimotonii]GBC62789.1 zinc ribbon domain-containing protein [Desulfonema ishimotonii]